MQQTLAVTPGESLQGMALVVGYFATAGFLALTAYCLHGTFMRPGSLGKRATRFLVAVLSIVAMAFIVMHTVPRRNQ